MSEKKYNSFTEGPIMYPLVRFAAPVLLALFLQAMYGAVDLLVVGQFGTSADVSAVATGSQITLLFTNIVNSFSMGVTIRLGHLLGMGKRDDAGKTIGAAIVEFFISALLLSLVMFFGAGGLSEIMQAPEEAFSLTESYVRICGAGSIILTAYVLIGSVFRGMGDSKTPLITVAIACVCNIVGDLVLVGGFGMGASGAAIATVAAQAVSVVLSLWIISRQNLPFDFKKEYIKPDKKIMGHITSLGLPMGIQDALVGISFCVILAVVNKLGVIPSAGVGVAEKVCGFIMLVPSAFMQSMAAFIAQNAGAGKFGRARKSLYYAIILSLAIGVVMGYFSFFHGDMLASIFAKDPEIIEAAADYLRAYAIDCVLTPFFFCFLGFFSGLGLTKFVMVQGIASAFCVRIPIAVFMSRQVPVSLFKIGLATPISSCTQIIMCLACMLWAGKKFGWRGKKQNNE